MSDGQLRYFEKYMYGLLTCGGVSYDYNNKEECIRQHIGYMLNRTQSMFKWNGLPETIPQRSLELYLQLNGNVCWYEYEGKLYVFTGGMGGVPNEYYMPTKYVIANPYLRLNTTLDIDKDCIVMKNDSMYIGLYPLHNKYATLMTEVELSMRIATINTRIVDLISASDDRTKLSAEKFLQDVEAGKLGVIAENAFLDGVKAQPYGTTGSRNNTTTSLIEMLQYLKASWYNELGINANYNMKREAINTSESQLNNDALFPLVDNMLRCRNEALELINEKYGTDISVELDSSWLDNVIELKQAETSINVDNSLANAEIDEIHEESTQVENEKDDSTQVENEKDESTQVENEKDDSTQVESEKEDSTQVENEKEDSTQVENEKEQENQENSKKKKE